MWSTFNQSGNHFFDTVSDCMHKEAVYISFLVNHILHARKEARLLLKEFGKLTTCMRLLFRPGNRSPSATNDVLLNVRLLAVILFSINDLSFLNRS